MGVSAAGRLQKGQAGRSGQGPGWLGRNMTVSWDRPEPEGPSASEKPESGRQSTSSDLNVSINVSSLRAVIFLSAFPASLESSKAWRSGLFHTKGPWGTSQVVQWLRLCVHSAGAWVPSLRSGIPQAASKSSQVAAKEVPRATKEMDDPACCDLVQPKKYLKQPQNSEIWREGCGQEPLSRCLIRHETVLSMRS